MNLYDTLGVGRNASPSEVRRAYRSKAKAAHPDGGGSVEKFGQLKLAHDILTDDERRERYDRTGNAEEAEVDDTLAHGMQFAMSAIDGILSAMDRADVPIWKTDVIEQAIIGVQMNIDQIDKAIADSKVAITKVEKIAKRFKAKRGAKPFIRMAMDAKVGGIRDDIRLKERQRACMVVALKVLKEHTYDTTPEPGTAPPVRMGSFVDMMSGSWS